MSCATTQAIAEGFAKQRKQFNQLDKAITLMKKKINYKQMGAMHIQISAFIAES